MSSTTDSSANLRLVIFQTELERFKYLIRSYLRVRIAKVCSQATLEILANHDRSTNMPSTT